MLYCDANSGSAATSPPPRARVVFVRRHEDLFTARRAGTAREGGPVQEPPAQGQVGMGGGRHVHSVARWQKFRPKSSKGAAEKKSWPKEIVAEFWLILPKSGRKGAAEKGPQKIFKRSSLFLAVITTYL